MHIDAYGRILLALLAVGFIPVKIKTNSGWDIVVGYITFVSLICLCSFLGLCAALGRLPW